MDVVNVTGVEPGFFITMALFVLFILAMLGLGILRLFQQMIRSGIAFIVVGLIGIIAFIIVLNIWYI